MKSQAEKGTGYCHMIFPCIFTEILQRGKSTMQLLYFIHNDEGLAGFYINTSNSSDGEKDAISTGRIATYNFSPTPLSERNLVEEKAHGHIYVTGNTVIDALHMVVDKLKADAGLAKEQDDILAQAGYNVERLSGGKKLVLITGHRRENFGDGFIRMVTAMKDLSEKYPDVDFVYPMHLNPNVRKPIHEVFGEDLTRPNFFFIEPLQYLEFVHLMSKATIVLTDSGGIQEEAPGLGKPVLVMRDTTERPEALASGTVHLVGTDYDKIVNEVSTLLDDACAYEKMSKAVNPYGDGQACRRIADILSGKETDRYDVELNK